MKTVALHPFTVRSISTAKARVARLEKLPVHEKSIHAGRNRHKQIKAKSKIQDELAYALAAE